MSYVSVTPLGRSKANTYTYRAAGLMRGDVTAINLGARSALGVVCGPAKPFRNAKTATASGVRLSENVLALADWLSAEYLTPLGVVYKQFVSQAVVRYQPAKPPESPQRPAVIPTTQVLSMPERWPIYRKQIAAASGSKLLLIPDGADSLALQNRVTRELPNALVFHSRLTPKQRAAIWWQVAAGQVTVVGTRSALFLPWSDLGLVVVDEEDDWSYKEIHAPTYHARAVAAKLASLAGCPITYGSLAPSLETCLLTRTSKLAWQEAAWQPPRLVLAHQSDRLVPYELESRLTESIAAGGLAWLAVPQHLQRDTAAALKAALPAVPIHLAQPGKPAADEPAGVTIGTYRTVQQLAGQPQVIGVLGCDYLLQLPDFRATEKMAAALRKLASRLATDGTMVVATEAPDHPAITSLGQSYQAFAKHELDERRRLGLPPYVRLSLLTVQAATPTAAVALAKQRAEIISAEGLPAAVIPPEPTADQAPEARVRILGDPKRLAGLLAPTERLMVDAIDLR